MRTFCCQVCGQPVYFENDRCEQCGATLGFLPDRMRLSALMPTDEGFWRVPDEACDLAVPPVREGWWRGRRGGKGRAAQPALAAPQALYRKCGNYLQHQTCNWMIPAVLDDGFCVACRLNRVIPNLMRPGHLEKWYRIERAKRRLMYGLLRLGLPVRDRFQDPAAGLGFAFLSPLDAAPGESVVTGHAEGLITLDIDEADPAVRERVRLDMDELYRTLVGHFRHEIGHYYWNLLIRDAGRLEPFRSRFGDERADYAAAMDAHYAQGAPAGWQDSFISAYASMHPWEDWAETWAHYLHIVDTLETSEHFGVRVSRRLPDGTRQSASPDFDPYEIEDFDPLIENWLPLTFALNSINRSMGLADLYPFVLSPTVIDKLAFVHRVVRETRTPGS